MAEKILLIQSRWMTGAMTQQKVELWRAKYPSADFTLLAPSPLKNGPVASLILPPLEKRAVLRFARQLRHIRFRRAIVLTDVGRGDVGYGEAKFWALVANARRREFDGKPLTLWREVQVKKKIIAVSLVRFLMRPYELLNPPRRAATIAPPELLNRARTFVYLQHAAHQHGAVPGRVLLIGEQWSAEAARCCGWQIADEKSAANLVLCEKSSIEKTDFLKANLLCYSGVADEFQPPEMMQEIENRAAFFDETARDIWLRTKR